MKKQEFLSSLKKRLSGLPRKEVEERLNFYGEMIDDRIEEGLTEEEAVSDIGTLNGIVAQVITDIPLTKIATERVKPKGRLKTWEIVLLLLGSPIWLSLGIALFSVVLSLYAVLWSLVISAWIVMVSLVGCAVGLLVAGIFFVFGGHALTGLATVGAATVCAGLAIFLLFGCKAATKGTVYLSGKIALGIKKCFIKREEV